MGLGGNTTCLAVKIKKAKTHIAGLPVGVNISCHALRSASVTINMQGADPRIGPKQNNKMKRIGTPIIKKNISLYLHKQKFEALRG